ncbi:hypothetical protein A3I46_02375 [Candidatus Kaiserbacteria bacterium RIFCSPLOWO2_02_FULL_54_13]|nr:MAG: Glycosyl transferase group 1 [Parcubacteria group bacterium GW2011_GWB1_55_9]OGG68169.1 MAG: hypothetical protein A3E99_03220 [Candidatus Kaiserbacteria bacterium RIFCSPHIGHO2_12_FULL_54_16]OGG82641.1 MAG: hypothetical protein A3I46_02375 [Candidatus Kaiserbacteria bacterium RIFCSPLOWO2_02_FULL_54_13]OGG90367.1 MAG: hypothetical protein A3G12_00145 [Candidatus Kaiserbacteria bacterium RIFCSPLOWO2_12_FULL_54_10]
MKVLTNIRFYTVGGIAQYLSNFILHNERRGSAALNIFGIDVVLPGAIQSTPSPELQAARRFCLITKEVAYPPIADTVKAASSIEKVRATYMPVIDAYYSAILEVQPDVILINGTFYLPWCLLQAARRYGRARIILHYHGVLTKEVEHWKEEGAKQMFREMEREFDMSGISYIFPSHHALHTVEREVYGHSIAQATVLPNPVPDSFFKRPKRVSGRIIGFVSRWTRVKNPEFFISLARHNRTTDAGYDIHAIVDVKKSAPHYRRVASLFKLSPPVENKLLPTFYRKLGALIMPSYFETYGNVAQEALASGIPVLVSPHTGFSETLRTIGLENWITDFSSPADVLVKIEEAIRIGVPHESWRQLRAQFTNEPIFARYANLLAGK